MGLFGILCEAGLRGRFARGSEADAASRGAWSVGRRWGLGWDVWAAIGIGGGIGAGGGAGLALVAAQVGQLLDGAEEAAAEVSVVAGEANEGLGAVEHRGAQELRLAVVTGAQLVGTAFFPCSGGFRRGQRRGSHSPNA